MHFHVYFQLASKFNKSDLIHFDRKQLYVKICTLSIT